MDYMERREFRVVLMRCFAVVVVAMTVAACVKDEKQPVLQESDKITFSMSVDKGFVSKSADGAPAGKSKFAGEHFLCAFGSDSIYLSVLEQSNSIQWKPVSDSAALDVKGAPIEDPSLGTNNVLDRCYVSAKLTAGDVYFADDQVLVPSGTTQRYWPAEGELNFFAYAPAAAKISIDNFVLSQDSEHWGSSFSYTMPADEQEGNDAEILPDYIYAISTGKVKGNGTVGLTFHHAFSAICFKVGTMPSNVIVKQIALKNIFSSATCVLTEGETEGALVFGWSDHSNQQSFEQYLGDSGNGVPVTGASDKGMVLNTKEQTFMVVPQVLPEDAEIEMLLVVDGEEVPFSKNLNSLGSGSSYEWLADKMYVYNISIQQGEVDVNIDDNVSGAVKSNVQITNDGTAASYIRAAVAGAWVVGEGESAYIVSDWKETDGEFVYSAQWDNYWIKGNDGFYYYKYPLAFGHSPEVPLFESYTLTAPPPYEYAKLQLNIMAQGVIATAVTQEGPWSVNLSNGLENN